ncbi:ERD4-related membrane [Chlorella sorokiniana]|uniref:ERD4-related membrane n=1 Tax=Chlorella sorokiniana TaxID=3076 RepID=A0A2P6TSF5_CHLSO|nr:ERD4-related membrane [Chlorella sorokiniana]|eukprot:PRW56997.1 ERD4-related membrane [Chlorella sorokiniana]
MASLASQGARSPRVAAPAGQRARPSNATAPRAARPAQQRPDTLNIKISQAAFAAEVSPDWQTFRVVARCPAGPADDFCKNRFELAVAEMLSGLQEDSGGEARTAGTFVAHTAGGTRIVCTRLSGTSQLVEELQRRMNKQGWVDLAPRGGRDPAWPGFAAVSTAASEGEREVALYGLPTGYRASALASHLRAAGWPISRTFRPTHPALGVKRDNVLAVLIPTDFALPQTVSLEVEGGETFVLQVKPESKLPPAPRFPGQASASWAAVAAGGAPRGAPRPPPAAPPAAPAGPAPPAPAAAEAAVDAAAASWRQAGFQVVFVQEPHLTFHTRTAIERRLRRHGWVAYISLSPTGPSGRARGGTAILIKQELLRSGVVSVVGGLRPSALGLHRPRVRLGFLTSNPLVQELQAWLDQELAAAPADHLGALVWWPSFKRRLAERFKASFLSILARLYTAVSTLGQVPAGFTDGLITILYKAGDRADPANYRPITLLCTDYRLYAKVLALRLNPCLADVIDREQTAFVPGRRIGENVLALQCLPELLRRQGRWAVCIFCDFRKAYDTLDRGFLFRAMAALGVGEGFLALRFAALQFADDAEVLLPSADDIPSFLSAMATFGDATGQRLNVEKTKVLPIGAVPSDLPPTAHGLQVVSEATSLGVTFASTPDPAAAATRWQEVLEGVEACYGRIASLRRLSIFGRGLASAAYGVSRLLYRAEFSGHPPTATTEALQRATSKLVGRGQAPHAQQRRFAEYPDGIDHEFFDFAAAGISTLGELLHLRQALTAVHSQAAYRMVWFAQLRGAYAFVERHVAAERVALLVDALPPGWVSAAQSAADQLAAGGVQPPAQPDALAAMIPCLAWRRSAAAAPLTLRTFRVREGTALLTAPLRRRRLQSYFTPFAVEAAGAAHDGSGQEVAALLQRLWRLRCDNGLKEPFWLLAHNGLPTAARLQSSCKCGAAAPGDRLHHYWACPVAAAVLSSIAAAAGGSIPRRAIWLCRAPAGIYAGVWDLVCLAAVAAMDHGRRTLYALSTGPPPEAPLSAIAGRSARARFWSNLADFIAFDCAPLSWRDHCPTGHPFIHTHPATSKLVVHCPEAVAAAPPNAA